MRFLTWNVGGRFDDHWPRRHRAIVDAIHAQSVDFVALQETWSADGTSQADMLGAELRMSSTFAPSRMPRDPDPGVQLGLAVLSRYPFLGIERHPLAGDTIAVRAEIRLGDRSLHFLTTCLDWDEDHDAQRAEQAGALLELVEKLSAVGDKVFVAGNLNAPPDRPEFMRLLSVLHDCSPDDTSYSSHNPYLGQGDWLEDQRIDYVLSADTPSRYRSWLAGLNEDGGLPPSDHYAVVADIAVTD
ncbi:endonuclease/exonuclease/phosphatase family metal-dependent hydrolase [Kribbella voronezhensis]|uniref:Endonuclease/exonuclease/phosphatase family metal-dependent hydrolase n=1 Tax=Kribbella voronezhensis TaxID=2512212 RepID=A0A4V3FIV8_9ACTN|nr:endonuclease/exonuclease/phosphatase family protein [Kribbella voronezhensis]TDU83903.1 endonuclease/exonuclease/phosphatase family metal-dependent hydrolase [Kribbella voronezhensis]